MAYGKTPAGLSSYETLAGDVAACVPDAHTILDLACGDGYLLQVLASRFPGARLVGIDMSPEELASARERLKGRADLQLANARALALEDGTCDAVTCHMALMLMDDAPAVITEVARVLRPNGIFAAIMDGGHTTDPVLGAFIRALHEEERTEELPPLTIGDPRVYDTDSLRELFSGDFATFEIYGEQLVLDGTADQVRSALLSMYNVHRLSTHGRTVVTDHLNSHISASTTPAGTVPCSVPVRRILATKR